MTVSIPRERCYYYECSDGRVRLTYFMPANELGKMVAARKVSRAVREDFPDGVDLDCTEPDFADFEAQYGYRPQHSADALRHAFFAIFSSTRGWRTYRGSGLIPADELEAKIAHVDRVVRAALPREAPDIPQPSASPGPGTPAALEPTFRPQPSGMPAPLPESAPFKERRRRRLQSVRLQARVEKALADVPVKGVDEKKPIDKQPFKKKIAFSKGKKPSEVFSLLQRRHQAGQSGGAA